MNPFTSILADRTRARHHGDPNADLCFLALADTSGNASVRTLVLRDINDNRVTLFINKTSPKWQIINAGGTAQLLLWYSSIQRQYRLTGSIEELNREIVETNWQLRPAGSKYLDHIYEQLGTQSSFVASRDVLTESISTLKQSSAPEEFMAPPSATGIQMVCTNVEMLDLNSEDRLHDRRFFTLEDDGWTSRIMIP